VKNVTDTAERLEAVGFSMSRMPEEQRNVLMELTDEEIRLLASIKQRLDAAGADVEGHLASSRVRASYIFW
jgi:hypothetical protein